MIWLFGQTSTAFIPKTRESEGDLSLYLEHASTNRTLVIDVEDVSANHLRYQFEITMPDDAYYGEYHYVLRDGSRAALTCGILQYPNPADEIQYEGIFTYSEYDRTK